jgi:hypothetical protein
MCIDTDRNASREPCDYRALGMFMDNPGLNLALAYSQFIRLSRLHLLKGIPCGLPFPGLPPSAHPLPEFLCQPDKPRCRHVLFPGLA